MVGHKRVPSHEGGVEVVVEELAARMVERGHTVTCYNRSGRPTRGAGSRYPQAEHRGIRLRWVPTLDRRGLAAVTSSFFGCLAAALGPYDVVHIHAEGPAAFCWLPRLMGKRVVLTVHGLDWARAKWQGQFASHYIRLGERIGAHFAHEVIVLNRGNQRYFQATYGRATQYIPNGVSRPVWRDAQLITERYGLTTGSYLLSLGRLVPEKGCHCLIQAFRRLRTDKTLVLAGESSDSDEYVASLRQLAAGDSRILFTGFVDGAVRDELYSNAYLFILPSDLEGMPICLLEALSFGRCVLVSDIEECTSVVGEYGFTFRRGDVADLEQKLCYAIEHPGAVQQFRQHAADYVCGRFRWDAIVEQTLALYRGESVEEI